MKIFWLILFMFCFSTQSKAHDLFRFELTRVRDLDTVVGNIHLPLGVSLRNSVIRLSGINAPELSTDLGKKQKHQLKGMLKGKSLHIYFPPESSKCSLKDNYGRYLGFIILDDNSILNFKILGMESVNQYNARNKKCNSFTESILKGEIKIDINHSDRSRY